MLCTPSTRTIAQIHQCAGVRGWRTSPAIHSSGNAGQQRESHQPELGQHVQEQVVRMIGEPEHARLRHLSVQSEMVPPELAEADAEQAGSRGTSDMAAFQMRGRSSAHDLEPTETRRGSRHVGFEQQLVQPGQKDAGHQRQ